MEDFERELKQGFLEEAAQLLADAERCFLTLESDPTNSAITDQLFRLAHNLKGSGKAVGFSDLGDFTHKLESLLLKVKNGEIQIQTATVNLLLRSNDHLQKWIAALREDLGATMDSRELAEEIERQLKGDFSSASSDAAPAGMPAAEDSRFEEDPTPVAETTPPAPEVTEAPEPVAAVSPAPVDSTPTQASVPSVPSAPSARPSQVVPPAAKPDESIRVSLSRLEKLINFVGELVILQSVLREQSNQDNAIALRKTIHQVGKVTKEVQDISMSLRMVPLKQTFQKMQRIVRDTSGALGKKIQLTIEGEDTEVDKTVLENLGDPLVHLIRNAVDHGIESAERRAQAGKPEAGAVLLRAFHQSGSLVIEIRDDGAGLDPQKLTAKAIEKGILRPGTKLSDSEAHALIFAPGFSTKTEVTDVSGRGVGMDVVKTNIAALQGDIAIDTVLGQGTTFRIRLPLTLAIIDGMIVKSAGERFVIPLSHVHETVRPEAKDIHTVTNFGEVYGLRGESLPMFRLSRLLGRNKAPEAKASDMIAIVVRAQGEPFAVLIDDIVGQAQVVLKKLGNEFSNVRGFSASAILGDGRPALVLELGDLIHQKRRAA